jgi:flagellar hook assembly protein FlgD
VVIKGLMADTELRIVDANGNLVKTLQGLGGEATWDITNTIGKRVASGIYTVVCNTKDGHAYSHVKVMIMN